MAMKFANSVRVALPRTIAPASPQLPRDERVARRDRALEGDGACRGRHALRVDVVLEEHGDPEEGAARPAATAVGVAATRFVERPRVQVQVGVEERSGVVIGGDAHVVHLHELLRRDETGLEGGLELRDGGFHQLQALRGAGRRIGSGRPGRQADGQQCERGSFHWDLLWERGADDPTGPRAPSSLFLGPEAAVAEPRREGQWPADGVATSQATNLTAASRFMGVSTIAWRR